MNERPVPPPSATTDEDDVAALQRALRGVATLATPNRATHARSKPAPLPLQQPAIPQSAITSLPLDTLNSDYRATTPLRRQNRAEHELRGPMPSAASPLPTPSSEFGALFGVSTPIDAKGRLWLETPKPPPIARQQQLDNARALPDGLSDALPWLNEDDSGEELLFLRPGSPREMLRKLRRGEWVMQAEVDFHGCTVDEARERFITFLQRCSELGLRCVRMVHGKGLSSPNREPVIKPRLRGWLVQREDVLAFCPAKHLDGGDGAVIVLLRGNRKKPTPS